MNNPWEEKDGLWKLETKNPPSIVNSGSEQPKQGLSQNLSIPLLEIESIKNFLNDKWKANFEKFKAISWIEFIGVLDINNWIIVYKNANGALQLTKCVNGNFFKSWSLNIDWKDYSASSIVSNTQNSSVFTADLFDEDTFETTSNTFKYDWNNKRSFSRQNNIDDSKNNISQDKTISAPGRKWYFDFPEYNTLDDESQKKYLEFASNPKNEFWGFVDEETWLMRYQNTDFVVRGKFLPVQFAQLIDGKFHEKISSLNIIWIERDNLEWKKYSISDVLEYLPPIELYIAILTDESTGKKYSHLIRYEDKDKRVAVGKKKEIIDQN